MKLTDCFDRVHVINLPYKQDRRERLSAHLEELGIADISKIYWDRAISGDQCWAPAYFKAGNGPWGCLQSHLRIVQDAIMDGIESYLVLEDDAVFHPRAEEMLERLMAELPTDWGQLYLGGQHLKTPEEVPSSPFILRGINVNRTHAFALNATTFAQFQQHITHAPDYIEQEGGWHIDHQLGIAHERRDWNVYCPSWWLAGQEEGNSNVSGNTNPRLWWNPQIYSGRLPFIWLDPNEKRPGSCAEGPPTAQPVKDQASKPEVELSDHYTPHIHFGNNLLPTTYQDLGLDACSEPISDHESSTDSYRVTDRLLPWLSMIAREAMDMGKIPGIQHPNITQEMVESLWPSGVQDAKNADLPAMTDYPFNGLFPHPWAIKEPSIPEANGSSAA